MEGAALDELAVEVAALRERPAGQGVPGPVAAAVVDGRGRPEVALPLSLLMLPLCPLCGPRRTHRLWPIFADVFTANGIGSKTGFWVETIRFGQGPDGGVDPWTCWGIWLDFIPWEGFALTFLGCVFANQCAHHKPWPPSPPGQHARSLGVNRSSSAKLCPRTEREALWVVALGRLQAFQYIAQDISSAGG